MWNDLIGQEFFSQGDRELAMDKEPLAMFNRNVADPLKGSIGFIDFVARPLYLLLVRPIVCLLPLKLCFVYIVATQAQFLDADGCMDRMDNNKRQLVENINKRDAKHEDADLRQNEQVVVSLGGV